VGGADGFDDDDVYDEPGAGHDRGGAGEDDGGGVSGGGEKDVDFGGYSIQDGPLLVTPSQGQLLRDRDEAEWLEVKVHVLLSRDEIAYCLRMLGLTEVVAILDCPERPRMGGGTAGMILATAQTLHQLRSAAEGLVRQLKRRRLHEVGVVGAELGPEGSFSSSGDARESWFVVDCQNYVVHLMDEPTRSALRLEDLWSGKDGLHRLDLLDESAVDEYVSRNPVPEEYSRRVLSYEAGGADDVLRQLEKIRWTVPLKPVTANQGKARGNRKGRKRRGSQ
jgi:ribosomal silencing factor RsfS